MTTTPTQAGLFLTASEHRQGFISRSFFSVFAALLLGLFASSAQAAPTFSIAPAEISLGEAATFSWSGGSGDCIKCGMTVVCGY